MGLLRGHWRSHWRSIWGRIAHEMECPPGIGLCEIWATAKVRVLMRHFAGDACVLWLCKPAPHSAALLSYCCSGSRGHSMQNQLWMGVDTLQQTERWRCCKFQELLRWMAHCVHIDTRTLNDLLGRTQSIRCSGQSNPTKDTWPSGQYSWTRSGSTSRDLKENAWF